MKKVLVLDFGGQYNLLVARRVRECGVYCEIKPYTMSMDDIRAFGPAAIIFTGGPATVFEPNAPALDNAIFELGLPILGICYGQQLMIHQLGGACRPRAARQHRTGGAAAKCGAAAPAVPVKDTIKTVAEDGAVTGTPDRSTLRAVQTPQVFEADLLKAALQSALENEVPVTDDCSAVERLGKVVYLIDGDEENLKITTPVDLVIAEAILAEREGR